MQLLHETIFIRKIQTNADDASLARNKMHKEKTNECAVEGISFERGMN